MNRGIFLQSSKNDKTYLVSLFQQTTGSFQTWKKKIGSQIQNMILDLF